MERDDFTQCKGLLNGLLSTENQDRLHPIREYLSGYTILYFLVFLLACGESSTADAKRTPR